MHIFSNHHQLILINTLSIYNYDISFSLNKRKQYPITKVALTQKIQISNMFYQEYFVLQVQVISFQFKTLDHFKAFQKFLLLGSTLDLCPHKLMKV